MKANTIEEVLKIIDELIERFERDNNPLGYFTAIYKMTTLKVYEMANKKGFEDNKRMERMDVVFANRYFEALNAYFSGAEASQPWQVAFEAAKNKNLVVDQQFFLSANAHINYDLGIAAATTCPGEEIHDFQKDFDKMNGILGSLYDTVNYDIAKIWPPLYKILKWFDKPIKKLENFYMVHERDKAWENAVKIATSNEQEKESIIKAFELKVAKNGRKISNPGFLFRTILTCISKSEKGTVADRIRILRS